VGGGGTYRDVSTVSYYTDSYLKLSYYEYTLSVSDRNRDVWFGVVLYQFVLYHIKTCTYRFSDEHI